jgi:hypothetical protein
MAFHAFKKLMTCGHLYGPGGMGERSPDIAPYISGRRIVDTFDIPGFVDRARMVTYESHHFWIHFLQNSIRKELCETIDGVLVIVHHGAGWEIWEGDNHIAAALKALDGSREIAFMLCWRMIDIARDHENKGYEDGRNAQRQAFVEGRLKKRRVSQTDTKVWIEPREGRYDSKQLTIVRTTPAMSDESPKAA